MKADVMKVKIAMARACMNITDIHTKSGMPIPTIKKVIHGKSVKPSTIGKFSKALEIDITEIIEQ